MPTNPQDTQGQTMPDTPSPDMGERREELSSSEPPGSSEGQADPASVPLAEGEVAGPVPAAEGYDSYPKLKCIVDDDGRRKRNSYSVAFLVDNVVIGTLALDENSAKAIAIPLQKGGAEVHLNLKS